MREPFADDTDYQQIGAGPFGTKRGGVGILEVESGDVAVQVLLWLGDQQQNDQCLTPRQACPSC